VVGVSGLGLGLRDGGGGGHGFRGGFVLRSGRLGSRLKREGGTLYEKSLSSIREGGNQTQTQVCARSMVALRTLQKQKNGKQKAGKRNGGDDFDLVARSVNLVARSAKPEKRSSSTLDGSVV
jgi:hypothetical protein